jgi:LmbE family N-acetylglucosaminyl deacetylase
MSCRLCAVFSHPDDESFGPAGTLARYADQGVEVSLITATSGESGQASTLPVPPDNLGARREGELRDALRHLGVQNLRLLHLPDGSLAGRTEELFAAVSAALREIRPQVVITEDVQGITGHPDHVAVTRAVVGAFDALEDDGPLKLYEHVLPASSARPGLFGTPEDYITTTINVEPWRDRILAALAAHRSQVSPDFLAARRAGPRPWINHYVCVRTRVPILIPEDDLFSGVTR